MKQGQETTSILQLGLVETMKVNRGRQTKTKN